jgi:DNA-binding SARP family transcriptional activator/tetratricopeptide (TPR) repeat protein
VLAVLLTRAGRPVAVDELAEFVWDGSPPARAADTLRTYVMRLRHSLGDAAGARIVTRDPGYLIEAAEDDIDALRFARACRDGAAAYRARQWAAASAALAGGLALWRGEPLSDVPSQLLPDAEVPALRRQRLQAQQQRIDADLRLGGGEELVAELHELTALEPLREQLAVLLMTALVRAGQAGEALAVYQRAREALMGQLGIEPGPELRELQRLILAGEQPGPRLTARVSPGAAHPVPRQLPAAAAGHFAGRASELKELDAILYQAGAVTISSIGGMGGIGKTTLALRWAHQVADRFPDGQLYVNLRGFGPATPMTAADALRGFLGALLGPGKTLPADQDTQEALYRSLTADHQLLIVLDNARDEEQVRPLLPGSASCLTLITSRSQLTGLVATSGAIPLSLGLLTETEAHELLTRRLGPQRLAAEPAAVDQLIATCTGLPLALSIAAARAALTPKLALTALSEQLSRPGLDALSSPDPYADLRSVFSWSYRRLSPDAARLFRCLPLFPGPDVSATAAATITPAGRTGELLDELTSTHLLEEYVPGRFRLHDLLARYAQECSRLADSAEARRAVSERVLTWYTAAAVAATRVVAPYRRSLPETGEPDPNPAELADRPTALKWLDNERHNLVAAAELAATLGFDAAAVTLPIALLTLFALRSLFHDWLSTSQSGIEAARRTGDLDAEAQLSDNLAMAYVSLGRAADAVGGLHRALAIWGANGNVYFQANARRELGIVYFELDRVPEAISEFEQAIRLARESGNQQVECGTLGNLGWLYQQIGQPEKALDHYLAAAAATRPGRTIYQDGLLQANLASLYLELGRFEDAVATATIAISLNEESGSRVEQANAHRSLGDALTATGRSDEARSQWRAALAIYRDLGDPQADEVAAKLA